MPRGVAVVTDSTAYLPAELAVRHTVDVVPLHVAVGGTAGREGIEVTPVEVASALGERRYAVTTSRPAPEELAAAYRRAFDAGASGVVSIHLSAALSGTFEAATLAGAGASGPVAVVDSRSTAMGLGFAVLAAAEAAGVAPVWRPFGPQRSTPRPGPSRCSTWTLSSTCGGAGGSALPPRWSVRRSR